MQELLKVYKERLLNLNARNSSLFLKNIYKKRSFDLYTLNEIEESFTDNIVKFILSSSEDDLVLIPDPYLILDEKQKSTQLLYNTGEISKEKLQNKMDCNKKLFNLMVDYSISLKTLLKEINVVEKETGRYELYIGFPFVEGKFKDGSTTRAPLILFPVSLAIKDTCILYKKGKPMWNNVFIKAFSKFNEVDIKIPDNELSLRHYENTDFAINDILQLLETIGIRICNNEKDTKISQFADNAKEDLSEENFGVLNVAKYLVMGRFPIANSIYYDYIELEKTEMTDGIVTRIFCNGSGSGKGYNGNELEYEHKLRFSESENMLFTSLDASQERAVKKASKEDLLVIYGPPGTGKSQTIANIVVDALYNKKKVLVVSQKRAALDVVYNRLSPIHPKVILVHDAEKGKQKFYKETVNVLENIVVKKLSDNHLVKRGKEIDEKIEELNTIAKSFDSPTEFGLTLQQMYTLSKALTGNDDPRYKKVLDFLNTHEFDSLKYQDIVNSVTNLTTTTISGIYHNYQKMIEESDEICYLSKEVYDELLVYNNYQAIDEIKIHLDLIDKVDPKYLSLFIRRSCNKSFVLNDTEIDELCTMINEESNFLLQTLPRNKNMVLKLFEEKKVHAQEDDNKKKYYELIRTSREIFLGIYKTLDEIQGRMSGFRSLFNNDYFFILFNQLLDKNLRDNIIERLCKFANSKFCDEVFLIKDVISATPELEKKIMRFTYNKDITVEEYKREIVDFKEIAVLANIKKIEAEDFSVISKYENYQSIISSIADLIHQKYSMTGDIVKAIWDQKLYPELLQLREIRRQCNKKRGNPTLRTLMYEYSKELQTIYPCWLLSPETVSEIMPLEEGLFDLIIFDEASQLFLEDSMPTIYRGRRIIVAGDDKQLRPNALFSGRVGIELREDEFLSAEYEEESLLDLAKVKFQSSHLNYYYRSIFEELINFSNFAFYGGRLQISPNVQKDIQQSPIKRVKVDGKWMDKSNLIEAEKVVDIIEDILTKRTIADTIGVITFNVGQKELIEERLEKRAIENPAFQSKYINEIDREINGEDVSLFVKNIENVQGDERDIIIFSVAYAKDERDRITSSFGSLSTDGGENRLNVAVSRAKKAIYLVTSIEPEELNVEGSKNLGPKLLKKYLQYARAVSNSNRDESTLILKSLLDSSVATRKDAEFDSPLEAEVFDALKKRGYLVDTQVGVSGYKIDLAIYDQKTSNYILGIECDGAAFHSSKDARERDLHRQRYLESRGWSISRIWSRDWWKNPDYETTKLCSIIDSKLQFVEDLFVVEVDNVRKVGIDNPGDIIINHDRDGDPQKLVEIQKETQIEIVETKDQLSLDDIGIIIDKSTFHNCNTGNDTEEQIESLDGLLDNLKVQYIDQRGKGGSLWILETNITKNQVKSLEDLGFQIRFAPNGGKVTSNIPAYYYKK